MTFHGETRELTETCNAALDSGRLVIDAEHTVDIRDFGVKPFKVMTLSIKPEVRLALHLVGAESGGSAPAWG